MAELRTIWVVGGYSRFGHKERAAAEERGIRVLTWACESFPTENLAAIFYPLHLFYSTSEFIHDLVRREVKTLRERYPNVPLHLLITDNWTPDTILADFERSQKSSHA